MHMQPASFALALLSFACALGWASVYCYSASFVTERILSNGNTMWSTNWFDYPPELRKYVLLIIARSQRPVFFTGLGLIKCTMETFRAVRILHITSKLRINVKIIVQ